MNRGIIALVVALPLMLSGCSTGDSQACVSATRKTQELWDGWQNQINIAAALERAGAQNSDEYARALDVASAFKSEAQKYADEASRLCG